MKKISLLIYPEFSLQEVMNLSRWFRWNYDAPTEVISSAKTPVRSEEGICVLPEKTVEEFCQEDSLCLILPGCSDFTQVLKDKRLFDFLGSFRGNSQFPIGAICSGPLFLARAGLLDGKKYTASIFWDLFDFCPFLDRENYVAAPLAVSGNIVTAGGNHFNGFAVAMARLLGFECPDRILSGYMDSWTREDYEQRLPKEAVEELKAVFSAL